MLVSRLPTAGLKSVRKDPGSRPLHQPMSSCAEPAWGKEPPIPEVDAVGPATVTNLDPNFPLAPPLDLLRTGTRAERQMAAPGEGLRVLDVLNSGLTSLLARDLALLCAGASAERDRMAVLVAGLPVLDAWNADSVFRVARRPSVYTLAPL